MQPCPAPRRRSYDHELRELVVRTGDPRLIRKHAIPRSTVASWGTRPRADVITDDILSADVEKLRERVLTLERRHRFLWEIVRLLLVLVRVTGARLHADRLPDGEHKAALLSAVDTARRNLPVRQALRVIGSSQARYQDWRRRRDAPCGLEDLSTCPRINPRQLTADEIMTIKDMATDPAYRHMPTSTLAVHAQRIGKVFAAATTWCRLIRERGWRRPRKPSRPRPSKTGIRANRPNELWHIDVTVIKLVDGTKLFLHGIIDNFSRKVLAWRLERKLMPATTCAVIKEASAYVESHDPAPHLYADSGVENVNGHVDALIDEGLIERVLAIVDVDFSNSMIEAFWRQLKANRLHDEPLETYDDVEARIAFYIEQHNSVMPHSALAGRTPDEVFFGREEDLPDRLRNQRHEARRLRMETNRATRCGRCIDADTPAARPDPPEP